MTYKNDRVVYHWVQQMHFLLDRYDTKNAQELDRILWTWLQLCNPTVILPNREYQIPEKGVSQVTILFYLNLRTLLYMSIDLHEVELSVDVFHRVTYGTWPYDELLIKELLLEADCRIRQGRHDESLTILKSLMKHTDNPHYLAKIRILMGETDNIKIPETFPFANFDNWSKALGYAEEIGNMQEICRIYGELGTALQPQYPALSLSMRWQAQVTAERNHDDHNIIGYILQRVYSEAHILTQYGQKLKNKELFIQDIERILSADRSKLPNDILKAFYDETRFCMLMDYEALYRALEFYEHAGFNEKVYRLANDAVNIASIIDDKSKMQSMLDYCYKAAVNMGDMAKQQQVSMKMKQIKES